MNGNERVKSEDTPRRMSLESRFAHTRCREHKLVNAMTVETLTFADKSPQPLANGGKSMKFTFQPESKPLDGYTIKRAIHRGGFGEVYYALTDAGKEVALKLLKQHFDVELRGVSQCLNLKHPNLVTIFDIKQDADGDHWVIMEYVAGKSLSQVLDGVSRRHAARRGSASGSPEWSRGSAFCTTGGSSTAI